MRKEFRGYDPLAVDVFLARCLATPGIYRSSFAELRGRSPSGERVTAQEIADVRFPKATWGYQIRAVDALLDALQEAVEVTAWTAPEPAERPSVPLVLGGLRRPASEPSAEVPARSS